MKNASCIAHRRQHARLGHDVVSSPKVRYFGAWLRAIRAERGIGRPLS